MTKTDNNSQATLSIPSIGELSNLRSSTRNGEAVKNKGEDHAASTEKVSTLYTAPYFGGSGRAELLELALRLIASKNPQSLVFYGPTGIGKSALFDAIHQRLHQQTSVIPLRGYYRSFRQILEDLSASVLGITRFSAVRDSASDQELSEMVKRSLSGRCDDARAVILIDDAHEIPPDQLILLLEYGQHIGAAAKMMLFVDTHGGQRLRNQILETFTYPVAIRPLSDASLESFLDTKSDVYQIDEENRGKIVELCEGIPGRIKYLAMHFDAAKKTARRAPAFLSTSGVAAGAFLIAMFSLAFEYHAQRTEQFHYAGQADQSETRLPVIRDTIPLNEVVVNAKKKETPGAHAELILPILNTNEILETGEFVAVDQTEASNPAEVEEQSTLGHQQTVVGLVTEVPDEAASAVLSDDSLPDFIELTETPAVVTETRSDEHRLLSNDEVNLFFNESEDAYVMQLLAGSSEHAMRAFEAQYELAGHEIRVYRTLLDGRVWFKATSDVIVGRANAVQRMQVLPEGLRASRPWLKRAQDVRAEINEFLTWAKNKELGSELARGY
ncbi:MAG: AAA family ATPase [Pseudomonadota bacterium]